MTQQGHDPNAKTDLAVALDYPTAKEAEHLIETLKGISVIYKIGMELFLNAGPEWVKKMTAQGERIFLDLKFHDIPNTVALSILQAQELGVEFVTVHLSGGRPMLDEMALHCFGGPRVLGVSVLTSFDEKDWAENGARIAKPGAALRSVEECVMEYANLANEHEAVGGLVCSALEVGPIREKYPDLFLMVPGIRLSGTEAHDQARVMTPAKAKQAGASAIVMGRPVILSQDPRKTVELILKEIQ